MQWLLTRTAQFPRSYRSSLGRRLQEQTFFLYEALIRASKAKQPQDALRTADEHLATMQGYLRLSHDLKLMSAG